MAEQPVNMLKFARDLSRFQAHLEWAKNGAGDGQYGDVCDEIAAAFQVLLEGLMDGRDPVEAIAEAIRVQGERADQNRAAGKAKNERWQQSYERKMAEEEITRTVECPYCGAAPGSTCRTTGEARNVRTDSHRARYRLARGLNEGAPPDEVNSAERDSRMLNVCNNVTDQVTRQWAARELDLHALEAGQISQVEFDQRWPGDQGAAPA